MAFPYIYICLTPQKEKKKKNSSFSVELNSWMWSGKVWNLNPWFAWSYEWVPNIQIQVEKGRGWFACNYIKLFLFSIRFLYSMMISVKLYGNMGLYIVTYLTLKWVVLDDFRMYLYLILGNVIYTCLKFTSSVQFSSTICVEQKKKIMVRVIPHSFMLKLRD